jgi:tetratricopeptide (TPR) repeat protein
VTNIPANAQQAIERARRGDIAGALDCAHQAIAEHPDDYGLRLFVATLHSRRLELDEALVHVRRAAELAPADPIPRVELVRLLIGLDRIDEAEAELDRKAFPGMEPLRLGAMIQARRENHARAAQLFRQVVAADPLDHESWGNLGGCLLASGRPQLAIEPLERAVRLRPDLRKFGEKLMEAQVAAGLGEQALDAARTFARQNEHQKEHAAGALLTAGRLEDLLGRPERALEVLQGLLASSPDHVPALVALATLLERENRIDEFAKVLERINRLGPDIAEIPLLRARLAYRKGELQVALRLAKAAPGAADAGARAQLIGLIEDRLGHSASAFPAFEQMNLVSDLSRTVIAERAQALRDLIDERAALITSGWVQSWPSFPDEAGRPEPVFLIGFPRSGTTLLDTFLMGHPKICIAEEQPMLLAVSEQLGEFRRLASLGEAELRALRDRYFRTAAKLIPDIENRLLIDKFPLGAIEIGIFHRLFPTAKIIFLQRHPCDVALSCFFARFQPTPMLISFSTLEDTAMLYDKVMSFWERSRGAMPLRVHNLKYEDLVLDPERQMRQLVDFLELDWDERVLDHEKSAGRRAFVQTASYAQITEPLYDRSIGRWKKYRDQLAPVLPILRPWAAHMGYEM